MKIPFYANTNRKATVEIFHGDVKVNEMQVDAAKGYNEASFDVSFSKKGLKAFKRANKNTSIKAAQNGTYYLPKGKYTIQIDGAKTSFEIK